MIKKQQLLSKAIQMATIAHSNQYDKGGVPYILHPLQVMKKLDSIDDHHDEELDCIAVLHDVVEDTTIKIVDLYSAGFTHRIVNAVDILTKKKEQPYSEYKKNILLNKDSMLVKYYDLEHNLDSTRLPAHLKATQNYLDRTEKYRQFQEEIINTLSNSLCGTAESGERLV